MVKNGIFQTKKAEQMCCSAQYMELKTDSFVTPCGHGVDGALRAPDDHRVVRVAYAQALPNPQA